MTYSAIDGSGNVGTATTLVTVPHDLGIGTEPLILSARETDLGTLFIWSPVPGAISYQVVRGDIANLQETRDSIDLGPVVCVPPGSISAYLVGREDTSMPAVGHGFFYVASYNDGRDSSYGSATASKPRVSTAGGCE